MINKLHTVRGIVEYSAENPEGKMIAECPLPEEEDKIFNAINWYLRTEQKEAIPTMELPHPGGTGYLDYLKPEDLLGPLARGIDPVGRPFVAMRVRLTNWRGDLVSSVWVLHRRYTTGTVWVKAGLYRSDHPGGFGALKDGDVEWFRHLWKHGFVYSYSGVRIELVK